MNLILKNNILTKYIIKKFIKYFVVISIFLTLICNLIDFIEKFSRNAGTLKAISSFILLNLIPNLIDMIPVSTYLASILLIKDLEQKNEWEYCYLVGINNKKIINTLIILGITISSFSFISKEFLFLNIERNAQNFKEENLKNPKNIFSNKWFQIDNSILAHMDTLDTKSLKGTNLNIYIYDETFSLEGKIEYKNFSLDLKNNLLIGTPKEIIFNTENIGCRDNVVQKTIDFFKSTYNQINKNIISNISSHTFKKEKTFKNELSNLFNRFFSYANSFIYIIFIFSLFFIYYPLSSFRNWFAILTIYPLMIIISNLSLFLSKQLLIPFLIVIFYSITIIAGLLLSQHVKKNY